MKRVLVKLENIAICCLTMISPKSSSKMLFYISQRKKINLYNPQSFNEKLMYLKLNNYNNNKLVIKCVDKKYLREYALSKGLDQDNLPELIGEYKNVSEIDFSKLPQKFALKCTHGCGFNIICSNKDNIDIDKTKRKLNKWLKVKYGYKTSELQYIHTKPIILCERFIENDNECFPYDYKFYCFGGRPKVVLVCSERETKLKLNFFDLNWNELSYGKEEYRNIKKIKKPKLFNKMLDIAKVLSKDFPFVRVDLYEYNNKVILGELTFTPAACCANYYSEKGQTELSKFLTDDLIKK